MAYTNQTGFASIALIIIVLVVGSTAGYLVFHPKGITPVIAPSPVLDFTFPSISPVQPKIAVTPSPVIRSTPIATPTQRNSSVISVSLDTPFTLKKGQVAQVAGTGIEIEITAFYNSPCPKGVQCFWSGVGMQLEYRKNGEVQKGMNLTQAFGYRTSILKTDHETYANLVFGTKVDQP